MRKIYVVVVLTVLLGILPLTGQGVQLKVEGKSALLMEVSTGKILYEANAHEPLAPASVTKVMTMLLIMEAVDSGQIALTDMVTASENAAAHERIGHAQIHCGVLCQRLCLCHGGTPGRQ